GAQQARRRRRAEGGGGELMALCEFDRASPALSRTAIRTSSRASPQAPSRELPGSRTHTACHLERSERSARSGAGFLTAFEMTDVALEMTDVAFGTTTGAQR